MINIRNLTNSKENKIIFKQNLEREKSILSQPVNNDIDPTFKDNLQKEKETLNFPLENKSPKKKKKIIKIDNFIFTPLHNIESFDYEINVGISKIETISRNYYIKIGDNEERISFEAKIFIEYLSHFNDFIDKVKQRKPLQFSTLQSANTRYILIDKFQAKTKDWLMDSSRNISYHTKEFSISGVLI